MGKFLERALISSTVVSSLASESAVTARHQIDLLIAADSAMDCQLLKNALGHSRTPFRVVACAISQAEIISSLRSYSPSVALINETLQDGPLSGFGTLSEIRHSFPNTKVVLLVKAAFPEVVVDAFRAGAKGVFCRAEPVQTLCRCISAVHQGQIWANSSQLRSVLDAFVDAAPLQIVSSKGKVLLTKREEEVVKFVVEGYTNREVAHKLHLTEHTVSNYLFRIYEKLGLSSRVELVLYSLKRAHSSEHHSGSHA